MNLWTWAAAIKLRDEAKKRKEKRAAKAVDLWPKRVKLKNPTAALRRRLIARLDTAFSLLVRLKTKQEVGHCAFCPKPIEHCFHFITRAKHSIRWDFRNAIGSCAGCNYRNEFDPHSYIAYFISRWGTEAYEQLVRDGNKISKHSNEDLRAILDSFTQTLKPLDAK